MEAWGVWRYPELWICMCWWPTHIKPWLPQSQHRRGGKHCTSTLSLPSQTLPQGTITSRVHEFSWGNLNKLIVTPERLLKTDHPSPAWRSRLTEAAYGLWKRSLPSNCVCVLRAVSWGFLPFLQGVLVSPILWGSSEVIMPALIPIGQWPCHAQTTAFCNT